MARGRPGGGDHGLLFLASLFVIPLIEPLQSLRFAYAPALVIVGLLMLGSARHIAYDDLTELVPAFAAVALVVFTYNIANGLTARLALYPLSRLPRGGPGAQARSLAARRDVFSLLWFRAPALISSGALNGMDFAARGVRRRGAHKVPYFHSLFGTHSPG
jgi:xanthine/uracil/vitamin C permease (AzgA family)